MIKAWFPLVAHLLSPYQRGYFAIVADDGTLHPEPEPRNTVVLIPTLTELAEGLTSGPQEALLVRVEPIGSARGLVVYTKVKSRELVLGITYAGITLEREYGCAIREMSGDLSLFYEQFSPLFDRSDRSQWVFDNFEQALCVLREKSSR